MRRLTKLRVDEISSVRRGAGEDCRVVLMKRDNKDRPPQGSVREKYEFLIQQLRRGFPDMPMRQARAEAWNALSDDEQIEILREEQQMNKLDSSELFEVWYRQLTPEQRKSYASRQRAIDAELASEGTSGDNQGSGGGAFNGRPTSPNIAPKAPKAPKFEKGADSWAKIAKDWGLAKFIKYVAETDSHGLTEPELAEIVKRHCEEAGESVSKLWATDTDLQKAAQNCRQGTWARMAERDLNAARVQGRLAQLEG
jgi:hypothetical protein